MKPNCCCLFKKLGRVFAEPRTFGGPRKRLMILLPLAYKMGVMTTMLGALLVLTLKGLTIGIILLILAVGNVFSKHKFHGFPHHPPTDIHVHVHHDVHGQAYSGWHKEYVDHPTLHADHPGYNRRRWLPQPQQTASLPYPDFFWRISQQRGRHTDTLLICVEHHKKRKCPWVPRNYLKVQNERKDILPLNLLNYIN